MRLVKVLSRGEGIRTLLWTFIKSFQVGIDDERVNSIIAFVILGVTVCGVTHRHAVLHLCCHRHASEYRNWRTDIEISLTISIPTWQIWHEWMKSTALWEHSSQGWERLPLSHLDVRQNRTRWWYCHQYQQQLSNFFQFTAGSFPVWNSLSPMSLRSACITVTSRWKIDRRLVKHGKRSCSVVDRVPIHYVTFDREHEEMKNAEVTLLFRTFSPSTFSAHSW
jgi:hypothetical protein